VHACNIISSSQRQISFNSRDTEREVKRRSRIVGSYSHSVVRIPRSRQHNGKFPCVALEGTRCRAEHVWKVTGISLSFPLHRDRQNDSNGVRDAALIKTAGVNVERILNGIPPSNAVATYMCACCTYVRLRDAIDRFDTRLRCQIERGYAICKFQLNKHKKRAIR